MPPPFLSRASLTFQGLPVRLGVSLSEAVDALGHPLIPPTLVHLRLLVLELELELVLVLMPSVLVVLTVQVYHQAAPQLVVHAHHYYQRCYRRSHHASSHAVGHPGPYRPPVRIDRGRGRGRGRVRDKWVITKRSNKTEALAGPPVPDKQISNWVLLTCIMPSKEAGSNFLATISSHRCSWSRQPQPQLHTQGESKPLHTTPASGALVDLYGGTGACSVALRLQRHLRGVGTTRKGK